MLVHVYLYSIKATLSACFKNNYASSTEYFYLYNNDTYVAT